MMAPSAEPKPVVQTMLLIGGISAATFVACISLFVFMPHLSGSLTGANFTMFDRFAPSVSAAGLAVGGPAAAKPVPVPVGRGRWVVATELFQEMDIFEVYLEELYDTVDAFYVLENNYTHQASKKPYNLELQRPRYKKYWDKIRYRKGTYNHSVIIRCLSDPWVCEKQQRDEMCAWARGWVPKHQLSRSTANRTHVMHCRREREASRLLFGTAKTLRLSRL